MKIISSFKDYYDFLQGKYGIDEKITYERISQYLLSKDERFEKCPLHKFDASGNPDGCNTKAQPKFFKLAVCGIIYCGYAWKGYFYFGRSGAKVLAEALGKAFQHYHYFYDKKGKPEEHFFYHGRHEYENHEIKTDINEKYSCPVILLQDGWREGVTKNVRLNDYGINQIVSPEQMYLNISTFLTAEKQVIDKRTDGQKIIGHGFDKKTSFRHPIK